MASWIAIERSQHSLARDRPVRRAPIGIGTILVILVAVLSK